MVALYADKKPYSLSSLHLHHAMRLPLASPSYGAGGDVAQSAERRTGTLPTRVRFPGSAMDFFSSQLSVQTLLQCPVLHAFTSVRTLKIS